MGGGVGCFVNEWDLCHPHPWLDLRLFRHRLFSAATASALLSYLVSSTLCHLPYPAPFDSGKPDAMAYGAGKPDASVPRSSLMIGKAPC